MKSSLLSPISGLSRLAILTLTSVLSLATVSCQQKDAVAPAVAGVATKQDVASIIQVNRHRADPYATHLYSTEYGDFFAYGTRYSVTFFSFEQPAFRAYDANPGGTVPLYRFSLQLKFGTFDTRPVFMYTTNEQERQGLLNAGWQPEGITAYVWNHPAPGTVPLYRLYSSGTSDHFFTTNAQESTNAQPAYTFEQVACYVLP